VAFSHDSEATQRHFGIDAVNRWNIPSMLSRLLQAKRFVLGGGGLLQETSGPFNHLYYLFLVVLAKTLGCRTETVGLGVDPIRYAPNRWLTGWVFNHMVDRSVVREKGSMRVLRSCGVDRTIDCQPDLVFDLDVKAGNPLASNKLALVVTDWPTRLGWDQDLALLCEALVQSLGVEIDLIPFFPAEDKAITESLISKSRVNLRLRLWEKPEELLSVISEYGLVVSMRFHALALAAKAGVPFVGWGVQMKIRQFCVDQSQPFWDFDRGWNSDSVVRQIRDAWEHFRQKPTKPTTTNLVYSRRTH
jgi:polysaccharide pyruvyl transferase CsaB